MSLMYHLVQRPDKSEGAGPDAKLYYGQIRVRQQITFDQLCETIADRSTASKGDVQVVLDGLIHVLNQQLQNGNSVQMGDFGSFRMSCGSKGVITKEEFDTSLFNRHLPLQEGQDHLYARRETEEHGRPAQVRAH